MSDVNPNPNLMDLARELFNGAIDIMGTPQENVLLENAAQVYEEAGSPHDAEVCRMLIEEESGE